MMLLSSSTTPPSTRDFQLNEIINIPYIHWYDKYCAFFQGHFIANLTSISGSYQKI